MAGLTVEDQCMTVAGPLLGTCRVELPDELESQTTTRVVLSSTSPPLAQSVGETDKRSVQHYEDRGAELCTGAEGLNAEAESFHANANGLKMKDGASRTLPAGGGKSVCDADGGTSQMPQRTKINHLNTGFVAQEWLRYRSRMKSSAFCKRYMDLWRKRAASCHILTSGTSRGGRHRSGHDYTKVVSIITEVKERSEPDIPHMPGPEYLVEDRPTHSIDEIDDAGESKTMEGYDDGCLLYRQEAERVDPSGGDGEGVSPRIRIPGGGSLNKVGSDSDDHLTAAMTGRQELGIISSESRKDVGFVSTRFAAWGSGRSTAVTLSEQESESNSSSSSVSLLPAKAGAGGGVCSSCSYDDRSCPSSLQ